MKKAVTEIEDKMSGPQRYFAKDIVTAAWSKTRMFLGSINKKDHRSFYVLTGLLGIHRLVSPAGFRQLQPQCE